MTVLATELDSQTVSVRGRSFQVFSPPVVTAGAREFTSGFEEGTLRFFDAALPRCDRVIDCGAYIGFTTLYAAGYGVEVTAFEPSRVNFQFLTANVEVNPVMAPRIKLYCHGIGTRDERVTLYTKGTRTADRRFFRLSSVTRRSSDARVRQWSCAARQTFCERPV